MNNHTNYIKILFVCIVVGVGFIVLYCLSKDSHVCISDINECITYINHSGDTNLNSITYFLPVENVIYNSDSIECLLIYDNAYWFEEPVYYLKLKILISNPMIFSKEIGRINQSIPHQKSVKIGEYQYLYYDESDINAIDNKLDKLILDGCMWNIRYTLVDQRSNLIKYCFIRVCDAKSIIDTEILHELMKVRSYMPNLE